MTRIGIGALAALAGGAAAAQEAGAIEALYEAAVAAGDVEALVALYAEDAVMAPMSGGLYEGREGIRGYYAQGLAASLDIRPERMDDLGGGVVVEHGTFTATLPEEAGGGTVEGEYVAVGQEGPEGFLIRSLTTFPPRGMMEE